MRWTALSVLAAVLFVTPVSLFVTPVSAEEACPSAKLKATQEKLAALLTKWQEASRVGAEEQAKVASELSRVAKSCPIGSRVRESVLLAQKSLAAALKADDECRKANGVRRMFPGNLDPSLRSG